MDPPAAAPTPRAPSPTLHAPCATAHSPLPCFQVAALLPAPLGPHMRSLAGLDLAKLARIALQVSKTSEALKTSEFFADLGERQIAMMASAGQRRRHPVRWLLAPRFGWPPP